MALRFFPNHFNTLAREKCSCDTRNIYREPSQQLSGNRQSPVGEKRNKKRTTIHFRHNVWVRFYSMQNGDKGEPTCWYQTLRQLTRGVVLRRVGVIPAPRVGFSRDNLYHEKYCRVTLQYLVWPGERDTGISTSSQGTCQHSFVTLARATTRVIMSVSHRLVSLGSDASTLL